MVGDILPNGTVSLDIYLQADRAPFAGSRDATELCGGFLHVKRSDSGSKARKVRKDVCVYPTRPRVAERQKKAGTSKPLYEAVTLQVV